MKKFIWRIAEMYAPLKWLLLRSLFLLIFVEIVGISVSFVYGKFVNAASNHDLNLIVLFAITYFLIRFTFRIIDWVRDKLSLRILTDTELHMSRITTSKILDYSVGQHNNEHSGIKRQIISNGEGAIRQATDQILFSLAPMTFSAVTTIIILLFYNSIVGLLVLLGAVIYLMVTIRAHSKFVVEVREVREKNRETRKIYEEIIRNVELIKFNAKEKETQGEYSEILSEANQLSLKVFGLVVDEWFLSGMIILLTSFAVYLTSGYMVSLDMITLGAMVSCIGWVESILGRLQNAGNIQRRLMDWQVDIERYFEMMDILCDIVVIDNPVRPKSYVGTITFEDITYSYPRRKCAGDIKDGEGTEKESGEKKNAVTDLSFTLEAGRRYAIVGESGSGKSTMKYLMLRACDPQKGRVLIDGIDLRTLDPQHYLRKVGVVDQDIKLFDRTLRENIVWTRDDKLPALTEKEVLFICHQACIDRFFDRLEKGLDTIIGERGVKLSGGEKQRVAIAMALAKEPSILICDEATSHLDSVNEADITESIEKASVGKTTIVIAHRLSTILSADEILVMSKGRLVGKGTHKELFATCEEYKVLVGSQIKALEKLHLAQLE